MQPALLTHDDWDNKHTIMIGSENVPDGKKVECSVSNFVLLENGFDGGIHGDAK